MKRKVLLTGVLLLASVFTMTYSGWSIVGYASIVILWIISGTEFFKKACMQKWNSNNMKIYLSSIVLVSVQFLGIFLNFNTRGFITFAETIMVILYCYFCSSVAEKEQIKYYRVNVYFLVCVALFVLGHYCFFYVKSIGEYKFVFRNSNNLGTVMLYFGLFLTLLRIYKVHHYIFIECILYLASFLSNTRSCMIVFFIICICYFILMRANGTTKKILFYCLLLMILLLPFIYVNLFGTELGIEINNYISKHTGKNFFFRPSYHLERCFLFNSAELLGIWNGRAVIPISKQLLIMP